MSDSSFPSLEARLAAAICSQMAAVFLTPSVMSGDRPDREMSLMAAIDVLDLLTQAGYGRQELETLPLQDLSRLTNLAVLQAAPLIWDVSEKIAAWAREHGPDEPS